MPLVTSTLELIDTLERALVREDRAAVEQLLAQFESSTEPLLQARAWQARGVQAYEQGDFQQAIDFYHRAQPIFESEAYYDGIAAIWMNLGNAYRRVGEMALAEQSYRQGLAVATEHGLRDTEARLLMNLAVDLDNAGQQHEALAEYERVLAIAREIRDPKLIRTAMQNIGAVSGELGDVVRGLACAHELLDLCIEARDVRGQSMALSTIAHIHRRQNDLPTALQFFERAVGVAEHGDLTLDAANDRLSIAAVLYDLGQTKEAEELTESVFAVVQQRGDLQAMHEAARDLGYYRSRRGDKEGTGGYYRKALDYALQLGYQPLIQRARRLVVINLCERGLLEEAHAEWALYQPGVHFDDQDPIMEHAARAAFAEAMNDLDLAREHFLRARDEARVRTFVQFELEAEQSLLGIAKQRQDFDAFVQHSEAVAALIERIRGAEVKSRIAVQSAEQQILQERQERERERAVLYSALPADVADRVIRGEQIHDQFESASVLFMDIAGFTTISDRIPPGHVVHLLKAIFNVCDDVCAEHGLTKIKTIGDSYLAVAGVPEPLADHAQRAARAALDMLDGLHALELTMDPKLGDTSWTKDVGEINVRIGLHCGPLVAGIVGEQRLQYDVWGDTVNVASRMESNGVPGSVNISANMAAALQGIADFAIESRGTIDVKGKGAMEMYLVARSS